MRNHSYENDFDLHENKPQPNDRNIVGRNMLRVLIATQHVALACCDRLAGA